MQFAYLGPAGTFSEEAARTYCNRMAGNALWELHPVRTIADLLVAVDGGAYDIGIVPVENSIEGPVVVTLDMLVHEVNLHIIGEHVLPVQHRLLARPGVDAGAIQQVISHPQALGQCRRGLARLVPDAHVVAANSTAEAAQIVARSSEPWAAIATALAARLYGLHVVADDVQDMEENATRFLAVARQPVARSGLDKTSIAFAFQADKPGNLYGALHEFAVRGVNLTKLESRPAKRMLGDYIFFVDMEGHQTDEDIAGALAAVQNMSAFFKVLGSYPRVRYENNNGQALGQRF